MGDEMKMKISIELIDGAFVFKDSRYEKGHKIRWQMSDRPDRLEIIEKMEGEVNQFIFYVSEKRPVTTGLLGVGPEK